MVAKHKISITATRQSNSSLGRVERPLSLVVQVEQALRQAIEDDRFPDGKLPPEVELAEQLGVGRETVRLAAEVLQREGLLLKCAVEERLLDLLKHQVRLSPSNRND